MCLLICWHLRQERCPSGSRGKLFLCWPVALAEGSLLHWLSPPALTLRASQGSCAVCVPVFAAAAIRKAFLFLFLLYHPWFCYASSLFPAWERAG